MPAAGAGVTSHGAVEAAPFLDDVQLSSGEFLRPPNEARQAVFRRLRRERPFSFHAEPDMPGLPKGPGYWAVTRHYGSANRDETVFARPDVFDVLRRPNPHVGFGGFGPHLCLGANLARREIAVLLTQLLRRFPEVGVAGEPDRLRSAFVNGFRRLPVRLGRPGGA
jgi:hypothetical protein